MRIHNVFHVAMLRKYHPDQSNVIVLEPVELSDGLSYVEKPVRILNRAERKLRSRSIPMVKVQWECHSEQEATWEVESELRKDFPELFEFGNQIP